MKTKIKKIWFVTIMIIFMSIPLFSCEKYKDNTDELTLSENGAIQESARGIDFIRQLNQIPKEDLSKQELDGLVFLREEEKLARDVYITLNETSPLRPLENISKSEQQHMDAIKYLLDRYEIKDPVVEDEIGTFKNSELQDLYNTLVEDGKKGRVEALKVAALIEEKDIYDLEHELNNNVDNKDITFVYENLLRASKNHLRAFTNVLSRYGFEYTAQILEPAYFNEIISE